MVSSSRAKGYRNQNKCIKYFETMGFEVAVVERNSKFLKEKDAYGLYDICCMNSHSTVWIQVTSNRPHTSKPFIEFSERHFQSDTLYQQWVWYDQKGWKVYDYKKGVKTITDMRKRK